MFTFRPIPLTSLHRSIALLISCITAFILLPTANASPPPPVVDDCSALRVMDYSKLGDGEAPTKIMLGSMQKGETVSKQQAWQNARRSRVMSIPIDEDITTLPDHCLVRGYVNPHIKFELRLPDIKNWNGKFLMSACDGFCGKLSSDHTMAGVISNYATMTTDGGHWGEHPFDGIWAMDNLQARIDFGYRANHVLLIAAKAIIETYYGKKQNYSYLTGCSKGGQAGVMSALRYPNDYDGIVSRGPTVNYTKVNVLRCAETTKAVVDDNGKILLGAERVVLIQKAVMEYCDGKDGLEDQLISDPRKCDFNPEALLCGKADSGFNCLNQTEVTALKKLYTPIKDNKGNQIYPAMALGSEMSWPAWAMPVDGDNNIYANQCGGEYLKYLAFRKSPGPNYDWRTFDWNKDNHLLSDMSPVFDADNPDLTGFRDSGAKMIVVHGWADSAIPAEATIEWYDKVSAFMGGRDKVTDFSRLFLLPGMNHCDGGVGPYTYSALDLLTKWVEKGVAPESMKTSHIIDGELQRTRPVYPYPLETVYKGRGDIDNAKNFKAHDPRK